MAQPTQPHEYGPVREVWFATLAAPGTKHSFLIRDDAYAKQGAQFSKTIRLGDPVSLGPNSTWRQTSWEGGNQQEVWSDKAMYHKATADTSSERGKAKLWPGWKQVVSNNARASTRYILVPGPIGFGADTPLYVGENNDAVFTDPTSGTATPPGGFQVGRYDPAAGTYTALKSDFGAGIRFMCRMNDLGDPRFYLFVGTAGGEFWTHDATLNSWNLEATDATQPAQLNCAVVFNDAVYFAQTNRLNKRTFVSPGPAAYQEVKKIYLSQGITGMAVWNNRIWISASVAGGVNQVLVSDGVSVVPAFKFPGDFWCMSMLDHYGSLYFAGWQQGSLGTSGYRGQIWRYNGASLTKVYEEGTAAEGEDHSPWNLASHKQYLVWARNGVPSTGKKAGLMMYDAELDAVVDGPTFDLDAATSRVHVTGLTVWADTLAAAFKDYHNYGGGNNNPCVVAHVKKTGAVRHTMGSFSGVSFSNQPTVREDYILSSVYDGELAGEQKVWLAGRVRLKIAAANSEVIVKVLLDETTTETTVATISYDGSNTNFRTVRFPLKASGVYLRSSTIQYKLYIRNSDSGNSESAANPIVDSVEVDYMPSPTKQLQRQLRVVANDGQFRLDGTTNPLNTTQLLQDKLEELWGAAVPVLFWDAGTAGGTPVSSGTEVMLKEFTAQSYRVDSLNNVVNSEISLTAIEVVTT